MRPVAVEIRFLVTKAADMDAVTSAVADLMIDAEEANKQLSDSGIAATLTTGNLMVNVTAQADEFDQALSIASKAIMNAVAKVEANTASQFTLIEQNAKFAA